ncbi:MAG: hypothetical protein ACJ8J0_22365 [Longimicrobiaceae bacterium]
MPGLKLIEVILGLVFVYLLLSLLCTAINEYIAGILNKRGRELFRAVDELLASDEVRTAFYGHPLITSLNPANTRIRERFAKIRQKLYGTRWIYRLVNWVRPSIRCQRYPSYLPARNFALALLNSTDYAAVHLGVPGAPVSTSGSPPGGAAGSPPDGGLVAETPEQLVRTFEALLQQSSADVSELLRDPSVASVLGSAGTPESLRNSLADLATGAEQKLHKLQDGVEVWFNNAMDRVSGTYKRYTQIALLLIGLVVAILLNVDTIRIWRTLSTNDQARQALVQRAIAFDSAARDTTRQATTDSAAADTTCAPVTGGAAQKAVAKVLAGEHLTCGEARTVLAVSRAQLDSTQLAVGWTDDELLKIGVATRGTDGTLSPVWNPLDWKQAIWPKLLGLLLTAIAVSLGAPFWFDLLNKIVNIRAAGRAPDERPRSPETGGKRLAEVAPK